MTVSTPHTWSEPDTLRGASPAAPAQGAQRVQPAHPPVRSSTPGPLNNGADATQQTSERLLAVDRVSLEYRSKDRVVRATHQVSFDDVVSHRQGRRIARLVEGLTRELGVEAAIHEDREIVLVRAPGLSASELESMVDGLWERRPGASHAEPT